MLRRIYMLFPRRHHLEKALDDLENLGVARNHLHTIARDGVDIEGLPEASLRQRSDFGARLERFLWNANLALFFLAMLVFVAALVAGTAGWALFAAIIMAGSFLAGNWFTRHIPHTHLAAFRAELGHGELMLLVDVPAWRVAEVERTIRARHPEVDISGVGWTLELLHT